MQTINKHQIASISVALIVIISVVIVLNLAVKLWWPDAGFASPFCVWLTFGFITIALRGKAEKLPSPEFVDLFGGFRFVRRLCIWPVQLLRKSETHRK